MEAGTVDELVVGIGTVTVVGTDAVTMVKEAVTVAGAGALTILSRPGNSNRGGRHGSRNRNGNRRSRNGN